MKETPTYEVTDLVETQESQKERGLRILTPDFMDKVYEALCMGSSLANIAETRNLRYSDLIKFVNGSEERKELLAEAMDMRRQYLVDKVLDQTINISASDLTRLFDEKGCLLPPGDWPDDIGAAIESIEVKEVWEGAGDRRAQVGETKKIKLWNKMKALEMVGQQHGIFKQKKEVELGSSLKDLVVRSYEDKINKAKDAEVIEVKDKEK